MAFGTVELDAGTGGATIAVDTIAGASFQRVKLAFGGEGTATPITSTVGLPVEVITSGGVAVDDFMLGTDFSAVFGTTDIVYAEDDATPATISGLAPLMERDDALATLTPAEGDWVGLRSNARGALWVELDLTNDVTIADGGNSITVDGTVTANLSATDNAVLDSIDAAVNGTLTVDSELPAAAALGDNTANPTAPAVGAFLHGLEGATWDRLTSTSGALDVQIAGQDADVTIADGGNSITVDNAGTFVVQVDGDALTALQLLDNIVQVEDAAHGTGDSGVMALAVRQDSQVDFGADGDYVPLSIDANGALRVSGGGGGTEYTEDAATPGDPVGGAVLLRREDGPVSIAADGDWVAQNATQYGAAYCQILDSSGNFVDTFGGSGGTAMVDDAAFTAGTTQGTPAFAMFDDTTPDSVDEGDGGVLRMSANRNLYSTIRDAAGNERGVNVNASNQMEVNLGASTVDVMLGSDFTAVFGSTDIVYAEDAATPATISGLAPLMERDDALATLTPVEGDWVGLRSNARGAMWVELDLTNDVTIADGGNSITIDGTVTANAGTGTFTVDLGANNDVTVDGENAHDGTTLGNPILLGARATNSVEGLTQVANADLTHLQADLNGVVLVRPHTTLEECLSERVSNTNGTSTNFSTFGAGGAGVHNYVTSITVHNSNASTNGYVDIRDGSAGSVIWTIPAPATGGAVVQFDPPLKGAANTALAYDVSAAISTVYISVNGFQAQG